MTGKTKRGKTGSRSRTAGSEHLCLTLMRVHEAVLGAKEPKDLFDRVCEAAVSEGLFKFALIGLFNAPDGGLRLISKAGMPEGPDLASFLSSVSSDRRFLEQFRQGNPVVWNEPSQEKEMRRAWDFLRSAGASSVAYFPICKEGKPFAVLMLGSEKAKAFGKKEVLLLQGAVANISCFIDKHESERGRMAAEYDLKELNAELEKRIRQAESATRRAQTYLDFMSHDLTNILTPIMTYAEMIFSDERVPIEDRKYGKVIVDHVLRAAKFITRVKNLAIAETMPIDKIEAGDLREAFLLAQSEVFKRYPSKDIEIEYGYPNDDPVMVIGGNLIESVLEEIFDNAIKYSVGPRVELKVMVSQVVSEGAQRFWRIEIADNGPGIYPQLRDALLAEASVEEKGLSRAISSGIPFIASIVKRLGGKFAIEDRVPGNHSNGTKMIITIPVYSP